MGVLGGSFNPPHLGHLALARCAVAELGLERVLLVPVSEPPHKPVSADDPGPRHRLELCRLLASATDVGARGQTAVEVCAIEVRRGGRSYTADTLGELRERLPGVPLTLIMGAEMALTLPSWRRPREIVRAARIAVAERVAPAGGAPARERVLEAVRGIDRGADVAFLRMAPVAVSSTLVRERLGRGEPVAELVGEAVAAYIERCGLYRAPVGARA